MSSIQLLLVSSLLAASSSLYIPRSTVKTVLIINDFSLDFVKSKPSTSMAAVGVCPADVRFTFSMKEEIVAFT